MNTLDALESIFLALVSAIVVVTTGAYVLQALKKRRRAMIMLRCYRKLRVISAVPLGISQCGRASRHACVMEIDGERKHLIPSPEAAARMRFCQPCVVVLYGNVIVWADPKVSLWEMAASLKKPRSEQEQESARRWSAIDREIERMEFDVLGGTTW